MAASLVNCNVVQDYVSMETEGDIPSYFGANLLETQIPPSFPGGILATPGVYYLVVEPLTDYKIDASMVRIGDSGNMPALYANQPSFPNGHYVYNGVEESMQNLFPEYLQEIRLLDSLGSDYGNCDNKVIVKVTLLPDFVMPGEDLAIEIDLDGTAIPCQEPGFENDPEAYSTMRFDVILTTGGGTLGSPIDVSQNPRIYMAEGFESETYALSPHDARNWEYLDGDFGPYNQGAGYPGGVPVVDPSGSWLSANPGSFTPSIYTNTSAIQGINPTWYTQYQTGQTQSNFSFWSTSTTQNISNTCGQMKVRGGRPEAWGAGIDVYHPNNGGNPLYIKNVFGRSYYRFREQGGDGFLDSSQFPFLTPGDTKLPSSLIYYITVGENPNYDLTEDAVDLWKILTRIGLVGQTGGTPGASCPQQGTSNPGYDELLISTKQDGVVIENNSWIDMNNCTIENVLTPNGTANKTVRITMPFKSDLIVDIWDQSYNNFPVFHNKFFINVYPYEVN